MQMATRASVSLGRPHVFPGRRHCPSKPVTLAVPATPLSLLSGGAMASPVVSPSKQSSGRCVLANVAYHPSLDIPVSKAVQLTVDLDDIALEGWIPGQVFEVTSLQQIRDIVLEEKNRKVLLMCKSKSCRPCKAFTVKYNRLAGQHTDVVFMSLIGESSMELRDLMIGMNIRSTPTFIGFWQGSIMHRHSGISVEKMEGILDSDWQKLAEQFPEKDIGDSLLSL